MKLKMTFYTQLKMLFMLIFVVCFFILLDLFYLDIKLDMQFCIYVILPLILIFIVPVFIIHLSYYLASKNVFYEINNDKIVIIADNKITVYKADEIKEIIFHMTANKSKDSAYRNFLFEDYYFGKIIFSNNKETIITCLHSNKIDKILIDNFNKAKILKIKTFYPVIW